MKQRAVLSYILLVPAPAVYIADKLGIASILFPVLILAALIVGIALLAKEKEDKALRRRAWIGVVLNAFAVVGMCIGAWAMIHYREAFAAGAGR